MAKIQNTIQAFCYLSATAWNLKTVIQTVKLNYSNKFLEFTGLQGLVVEVVAVVVAGVAEAVALAAVKILDIFFIYLWHYHSQQTFIKSFLIIILVYTLYRYQWMWK